MKLNIFLTIGIASTLLTAMAVRAAGPVVTVSRVDETSVTGTLAGLEEGKVLLTSPDVKVPLEDVVELTIKGSAASTVVDSKARKLTGRVIGTDGSFNNGIHTRDKVFDADPDTFFDAPGEVKDAWVGLDLGSPKIIAEIKYAPRPSSDYFRRRMLGGRFQGSDQADFSSGVVEFFIITNVPPPGKLTVKKVTVTQAFQYVRYLTPENGGCNIAEAEFWGSDGKVGAAVKPATTRTAVGTPNEIVKVHPALPDVKRVVGNIFTLTEAPTTAPAVPVTKLPGDGDILVHGRDAYIKLALPVHAATTSAPSPATTQARHDPAWKILLVGDDQLTAKIGGWSDQKLHITALPGMAERLDIPIEQVRELWCGTADQIKQAQAIKPDEAVEDAAFVLKDGAIVSVRGVALGFDADALLFKFNDESKRINLSKLVGVIFGGQVPKRDDSFRQTFQLKNGDMLSGSWRSFDNAANAIGLETRWGAKLGIPIDQVVRIRSINGRLVYVGNLKPATVEQKPYFDRMLPYRIDKSLTGGPLKLSDGEYPHGIAVHSRTVLTYDIAGIYEEFKTKVGFQQPEGKLGQAVVRVWGDGKVLYENLDARGDAKPVEVSVKVAGVQRLTLEVDFGKNEDTGDRVVWANARLLRAKK